MAGTGKKSNKFGFPIAMVLITLLAVGGGFGLGKMLLARLHPAAAETVAGAPNAVPASSGYGSDTQVKELPAIVTNLAGSEGTEVRLQVSIVYLKSSLPDAAVMVAKLSDDIVAFLKTITLPQLQGASGLQNLRDDLNERASIRSQGAIREVIIETLATR